TDAPCWNAFATWWCSGRASVAVALALVDHFALELARILQDPPELVEVALRIREPSRILAGFRRGPDAVEHRPAGEVVLDGRRPLRGAATRAAMQALADRP